MTGMRFYSFHTGLPRRFYGWQKRVTSSKVWDLKQAIGGLKQAQENTKDFGIHGKGRQADSFAVIVSLIGLYQAPALPKFMDEWCMWSTLMAMGAGMQHHMPSWTPRLAEMMHSKKEPALPKSWLIGIQVPWLCMGSADIFFTWS